MGLKDYFQKASGEADEKYKEFTRSQVEQLLLAENSGVKNTECFKHKEWGPTLMNCCWNREKEKQNLDSIYRLAEWLGSKLPKNEDGQLYDGSDLICYQLSVLDKGGILRDPVYDEDGNFNQEMYVFLITKDKMLLNGSELMTSGRVAFTAQMGWTDDVVLMGEGIRSAVEIAQSLQSWAANDDFGGPNTPTDPWAVVASRGYKMQNILLTLDDMNIRGYQLLYAIDYAGGSTQRLFELLRGSRQQELCDYINMRSAKDYLSGILTHNQIAVTGGASFQHPSSMIGHERISLTMTHDTAGSYATLDIKEQTIDWGRLDIFNSVDTDSAIKICEARGFKVIRKIKKKSSFGEDAMCLLLYNPDTKDYVYANCAKSDDVAYGGIDLIVHRTVPTDAPLSYFNMSCSYSKHNDQDGSYFSFHHDKGLFRNWNALLPYVPEVDYDWSLIGFSGMSGIPIPKYFELPFMRDADRWSILGPAADVFDDMGGWYFCNLVCALLALSDDELINSVSPHYKLLEDWVINGGVNNLVGWYTGNCGDNAWKMISVALTYLKVPDEMTERIREGIGQYFAKRDIIEVERFGDKGRVTNEKDGRKIAKKITNNYDMAATVIRGYCLAPPEELVVKPYWLR